MELKMKHLLMRLQFCYINNKETGYKILLDKNKQMDSFELQGDLNFPSLLFITETPTCRVRVEWRRNK